MKNQVRIALMCSALMLSCLPAHANPILELKKLFKTGKRKLAVTLDPFSRLTAEFLPTLVAKAGGKEEAAQLITKQKQLKLDTLVTRQLLIEIGDEMKYAPSIKKIAMAIPIRFIKSRNKRKQKKLQTIEAQYPELKTIGLVRWGVRYFLGGSPDLIPTFLKIFKKLQLKKEKVAIPTPEGATSVCSAIIFSCLPTRAEHPILESMKLFTTGQKELDELLDPFSHLAAEFLPSLVAKAGGKEKAEQLITKHKKLKLDTMITHQILVEIEDELKNAPPNKKAILASPIGLIQIRNTQKQKELQNIEAQYPELKTIGLIRWGIRYFVGGSEALIPMLLKLFKKFRPKKEKVAPTTATKGTGEKL